MTSPANDCRTTPACYLPNLPAETSRRTGNRQPDEKQSGAKGHEESCGTLRTFVGLDPIIESTAISNKTKEINYLFPLWLIGEWSGAETRANIDPAVAADVTDSTGLAYRDRPAARRPDWDGRGDLRADYGPQDLFDWIYAVLHSESYRTRYAEFIKSDFARLPLPQSTGLFRALAGHGRELDELHLLESPKRDKFIGNYTGPRNPEVGRVGWSDGTVWLDAVRTSAREGNRATKPGTIGFQGVPEDVWDFQIGGYQVPHKWLKDRKGRTLSVEDVDHYQNIVVALNETIHIMAEIDEVIEAHGGWPGAFQAVSEADAEPEGGRR